MKMKLFFLFFLVLLLLTSCEKTEESDGIHEHTFSNEIAYDENGHWYTSTCEHTDEKGSYEEHNYNLWEIIKAPSQTEKGLKVRACKDCQFTQEEEIDIIHIHTYDTKLSYDYSSHWFSASCEHNNLIKDKEEHILKNGKCEICDFKFDFDCLKYRLDEVSNSYYISGLLNLKFDEITIPLKHNDKNIIGIDADAFKNCTNLKNVYFEGTPDDWCNISLANIYSNPMSITSNFYFKINGNYSLLENLEINSKSIGDYQFYNYVSLKSIVISNSAEKIGKSVFEKCLCVNDVTIPFIGDSKDSNYSFTYLFGVEAINEENKPLPENIKSIKLTGSFLIKEFSFRYMSNLKELIVGDDILGYEENCFMGLDNLENLELPFLSNVEKKWSLSNLFRIIRYNSDNLNIIINGGYIYAYNIDIVGINSLTLNNVSINANAIDNFPKKLIINSDLDSLKLSGFNSGLEYIEINGNIDTIKSSCFERHKDLKTVLMNGNVRKIEKYAFLYCKNLEYVKLSDSLESIEENAFESCFSLSNIILPSTLQYLGKESFLNCYRLIEIYNLTSLDTDIIKASNINDYNIQTHKSLNSNSIIKKEDNILYYVKDNKYYAFSYLGNEENVVLPDYINDNEYILKFSTITCNSIVKTITLGKGIITVEENAFYLCDNLENIIITNEDTILKYGVFNKFDDLVYNRFNNAYYLGTVDNPYLWLIKATYTTISSCEIHEDTKYIHQGAFANCTKLTAITIPSNVILIQKNAFVGCSNLANIVYNGNPVIE